MNLTRPEEMVAPPGVWPEPRDSRFRQFLRHWAERRSGLMMPRTAIDPIAIKSCLPHVWMVQYQAEIDDFRCTLAGEAVNQAWGMSIGGKRLSDYMPAGMLQRAMASYRRMLAVPALQVSCRSITRADAMEHGAERLILPVSDDSGRPYGVFGISLYYFADEDRTMTPQHVQGGDVVFYPCAALPAEPPA